MDWESMEEDSSPVVQEIFELNNLSEYIGSYSYVPAEYIMEGSIEDLYDIIYSDSVNSTLFNAPYMDEGNIEGYIGNIMATILQENNYEIDYQKYFYQGKEGYVVFLSLSQAKDFVPPKKDDKRMIQQIKKIGDKQDKTEKKLPSLRKSVPSTDKMKNLQQGRERMPKIPGALNTPLPRGFEGQNEREEYFPHSPNLEEQNMPLSFSDPSMDTPSIPARQHGNEWDSFVHGLENDLNQAGAYSAIPPVNAVQENPELEIKIDPNADRAKKIIAPKPTHLIPQMYMNLPQEKKKEHYSEWQDFIEGLDESVNTPQSPTARVQPENEFLEDLKADLAPHLQEISHQYDQAGYYEQQAPAQPGYYGQQAPAQPGYYDQQAPAQPGYYGQQIPAQPGYYDQQAPAQPGYYDQQPAQAGYYEQQVPGQPGYYGQTPAIDENQEKKLDPSQTESKIFKGRHLILTKEEIALESATQKYWQKNNVTEEENQRVYQTEVAAQLAEKQKKAMRSDNFPMEKKGYIPSSPQNIEKEMYSEDAAYPYDSYSQEKFQEETENNPVISEDIIFSEQNAPELEEKEPKRRSLFFKVAIFILFFLLILGAGGYIWYFNGGEATLNPYLEKAKTFYMAIHEFIQEKKQEEDKKNIFLENIKALEQELSQIRNKTNTKNNAEWKTNIQLWDDFINKVKSKPEYKNILDTALIEKNKTIEGCQEYLKQAIPQLLEKQQFLQSIDLLKNYKEIPQMKEVCNALEGETITKAAALLNESMEIAKKILVNEEFKEPDIISRTLEYLEKSNQNQTLELKKDMEKQKATFFKPFVDRCEDLKKYEYGIRFLAKYLGMQGPHHLLKTEEYITRLIHRHMLYYTSRNQYNMALQVVQKYEDIASNFIKNALQKFTNEIHAEHFFWQQLWRGVENLRSSGKEIHFDRLRDKEGVSGKGKITRFQESRQLIEIMISNRIIMNINKLSWQSLKAIFEASGNISRSAQETSYYGGLYLFSQGHIKEAEEEFTKANRLEDFKYKMQY